MTSLLHTLLELGHITSQNLGFAQTTHGGITFSEETITETNLLEFRRRHPQNVHVYSFSKATESKVTGADWEWHIIGQARTLKMRVQAKRIYKAGGIGNLAQQGSTASMSQIDLLLHDSEINGLLPIYCFYCSEPQRRHWTIGRSSDKEQSPMETGCLITDAYLVKKISPKKLSSIESHCVPWHYLWSQREFSQSKHPYMVRFHDVIGAIRYLEYIAPSDHNTKFEKRFPTIVELTNGEVEPNRLRGIYATADSPLSVQSAVSYRERGISRLLQIDAREPDLFRGLIEGRRPE